MVKIVKDQTPSSIGAENKANHKKLENITSNIKDQSLQIDKQSLKTPDVTQTDKISTASLAFLKESIHNTPDINDALVSDIQEKIKKGEYKIDFKELAEKMLDASFEEDL